MNSEFRRATPNGKANRLIHQAAVVGALLLTILAGEHANVGEYIAHTNELSIGSSEILARSRNESDFEAYNTFAEIHGSGDHSDDGEPKDSLVFQIGEATVQYLHPELPAPIETN